MRASALAAISALVVLTVAGGTARAFVPGPAVDVSAASSADTGGLIVPPEWSGDGVLVFTGKAGDGTQALRKVNADGSGQTDVTTIDAAGQTTANIAVNASTTVFVPKTAAPPFPLKSILLDGTSLTQIASFADDTPTKFSPDASQLAFTQSGGVNVVSAGGGAVTALLSPAAPSSSSLVRWATNNKLYALKLSPPAAPQLYSIDPNPASTPTFSPIVLSPGQSPAVSPDGTKVLWSNAGGLHIANFDGTGGVDLDNAGQQGSFSSDGSLIAYVAPTGIYTIKPDGTSKTLVSTSTDCILPRFNPSTTKLACFHLTTKAIATVTLPTAEIPVNAPDENVHVNDSAQVFPPVSASPADDNVHVNDSAQVFPPASASANEGVGVEDEVHIYPPVSANDSEGVGINDSIVVTPSPVVTDGEGVGISDSVATTVVADHFTVVSSRSSAGMGESFGITITARDAANKAIKGFSGNVSITDTSGTIGVGAYAFVNGVATPTVTIGAPFTNDTITVTDPRTSPSATGTSGPITVFGPLDHFSVKPALAKVAAGAAFGVTIVAYDVQNHVVKSYPGPVTLTDTSGSVAVLSPGVWLNGAVTETVDVANPTPLDTLTAADASGLTSVSSPSAAFMVYGPADHFTVSLTPSSFEPNSPTTLTVTARDALNTAVASYAGSPTITDDSGTIALGGALTFVSGVAKVQAAVAVPWAGDHATATDGSATGTSAAFTVYGPLDHFTATISPALFAAGTDSTLTVTAKDALNSTIPTYAGTPTLTDATGTVAPDGPWTWTKGVAKEPVTVANAAVADHITAADGAVTGTTAAFTVYGVLDHFVAAITPYVFGVGTDSVLTVTAKDALNTTIPTYAGTPAISDSTGTLSADGPWTWTKGIGKVNVLESTPAINNHATLADGPANGTTGAFTVFGPLDHFVVSIAPANFALGADATLTVTAKDSLNTTIVTYSSSPSLSDATGTVAPDGAWVWTKGVGKLSVTVGTAAKADHVLVADGPAAGTSGAFNVLGPVTHFTVTAGPTLVTVNTGVLSVKVVAQDDAANTITAYAGPVTYADANGTATVHLVSEAWSGGVATVKLTISTAKTGDKLTVKDAGDPSVQGTSGLFTVR